MTPEARLAAAAEILDGYLAETPAEKLLTNWARRNRFAGSKDRAAVRDHVFGAIRRRRSAAWLGGSETGRGLVIGLLRSLGEDPGTFLTGVGHAMAPLTDAERQVPPAPVGNVALDCPDWLEAPLRDSLGAEFGPVMERMRDRAAVFIRVNRMRTDRDALRTRLEAEGIQSEPVSLATTALQVGQGVRGLRNAASFRDGLFEIQDAASQAVAEAVPLPNGARVLDFCAGGGGKALALAARGCGEIFVHDANPGRMADIPERAARAGARLNILPAGRLESAGPFDLVICDVPCSGSGAWRRQPEAKWRLDVAELGRTEALQAKILERVSEFVRPGGAIAYMTCSLLWTENEARVAGFLENHPGWQREKELRLSPLEGGDGFFFAHLRKPD